MKRFLRDIIFNVLMINLAKFGILIVGAFTPTVKLLISLAFVPG
jgi:hypothetical protein